MNLAEVEKKFWASGKLDADYASWLIQEVKLLMSQRTDDHSTIERLKVYCECHRIQAVDRGNSYKRLAAENERLTALCDGYRGEIEKLKSERDELNSDIVTYDMNLHAAARMAKANSERAEQAESALTRARAEGMEEAAKIVDAACLTKCDCDKCANTRGLATSIRERIKGDDNDEG